VDLYPTLAELCDVPVPEDIQGQGFCSLLDNPEGPGKAAAYTVVTRGKQLGRSIRTTGWRYAEWGSAEACELYDLEHDPQEYRNLATLPQHRSQLERMRALLRESQARAALD
jgi:arylsulfatase A-like enzyme